MAGAARIEIEAVGLWRFWIWMWYDMLQTSIPVAFRLILRICGIYDCLFDHFYLIEMLYRACAVWLVVMFITVRWWASAIAVLPKQLPTEVKPWRFTRYISG